MPKIAYEPVKDFHEATKQVIAWANKIIEEYQEDGFDLTLRQLYYQFVARDLIPNKQSEYNRLGRIVNDGRMCGLIDWDAIEDRTRNRKGLRHFDDPEDVIKYSYYQYNIDMWENQDYHVEVWIEKGALTGVIRGVCNRHDVSFFSCRGYVSQSEMWRAGRRLGEKYFLDNKKPVILHLGDHDPSGIDMSRDIEERLNMFAVEPEHRDSIGSFEIDVRRIALNMDQIEELEPPPNPAKVTDSRFEDYQKIHGSQSWELDALDPKFISNLIEEEVKNLRDESSWQEAEERYEEDRENLLEISTRFDDIVEHLNGN